MLYLIFLFISPRFYGLISLASGRLYYLFDCGQCEANVFAIMVKLIGRLSSKQQFAGGS